MSPCVASRSQWLGCFIARITTCSNLSAYVRTLHLISELVLLEPVHCICITVRMAVRCIRSINNPVRIIFYVAVMSLLSARSAQSYVGTTRPLHDVIQTANSSPPKCSLEEPKTPVRVKTCLFLATGASTGWGCFRIMGVSRF